MQNGHRGRVNTTGTWNGNRDRVARRWALARETGERSRRNARKVGRRPRAERDTRNRDQIGDLRAGKLPPLE